LVPIDLAGAHEDYKIKGAPPCISREEIPGLREGAGAPPHLLSAVILFLSSNSISSHNTLVLRASNSALEDLLAHPSLYLFHSSIITTPCTITRSPSPALVPPTWPLIASTKPSRSRTSPFRSKTSPSPSTMCPAR
jgi:hypothetical protein